MINSVAIKNFETHLDTTFELGPGVNVFQGESDEGKSGIIRAITWNAKNRPQGDEYRNDQLDPKKKEDKIKATSVAIDYRGTGLVTRSRNGVVGGVNNYQIDAEEPLRALRTDIPDEVQDVTKMKAVNIQGQHPTEQYFLLANKPGQVAKELNKVSGLTIMDKATADINSQVRTCNAAIKISEKAIEKHQKDIDDTEWVDAAEKFANKLDTFVVKMDKKQIEYDNINNKVMRVLKINEILEKQYKGLDDAAKGLKVLEKEAADIILKEHEQDVITDLILAMKSIDKELKSSVDTEKALKALKELKILENDIAKKEKVLDTLYTQINRIEKKQKEITKIEIELIDARADYTKIWRGQGCPTCGRSGI